MADQPECSCCMIIGLIGKANVGKSTFFNAATDLTVPVANYPFTTIEPNVGVAYARTKCVCREFGVQDNPVHSVCIDGNRFIPVKLIDVAGLVPGAHAGKGLGNKFLDDARQADVLIHVIDASASTDNNGRPVRAGTGDPTFDIRFVEEEFDLWIESIIGRDWSKIAREAESQGQKLEQLLAKRLSGLAISEQVITTAIQTSGLSLKKPVTWNHDDVLLLCKVLRTKAKPFVIAANKADLPSAEDNIKKMKAGGLEVIPCASEAEALLRKASKKGILHYLPGDASFDVKPEVTLNAPQQKALDIVKGFMQKYGSTGVQEVINIACFKFLRMVEVYPVEDEFKLTDKKGNILPDVWLLPEGSTAKDLAGAIHADLAKGFLYAIDVRTKQRMIDNTMLCLGIESTAHTFGCSVVDSTGNILSDARDVYKAPEGSGIHPREASRHHMELSPDILRNALKSANVTMKNIDIVGYSAGPGLGPCLRVGAVVARTVSGFYKKPLVRVNHALGHLELGAMLTGASDPLVLLVSGGHTMILAFSHRRWRVFGETLDITVGQLLDQFGRALGFASPCGNKIEQLASQSAGRYIQLPYIIKGNDVSFSGLLTAAVRLASCNSELADTCYSLQETAFAMLAEAVERALSFTSKKEMMIVGGVAANKRLAQMLDGVCSRQDAKLFVCPIKFAGDNGAQIAWTALQEYLATKINIQVQESTVQQSWRLDTVDVIWRR